VTEPLYYELSSYLTGGGVTTRSSLLPPDGQVMVVDYLYAMAVQTGGVGTLMQQININSASGQAARGLWYQRLNSGTAVVIPGFAIAPRLRLQPGEYIYLYQVVPSDSNAYLVVHYHFEPADEPIDEDRTYIPPTRYTCTEVIPGLCL